ncbi:MAG: SLBB domain-containing protein [Planctomycetales bacterium]|nr:SLBB domain-containing protein [Planctomycetales bacterium]
MVLVFYIEPQVSRSIMPSTQLLNRIRNAGVVGAGGAGFPTYQKLSAKVGDLIVNGAECEPLLAKDRAALLHARPQLLEGLRVMQELTGAENVTLAVKHKNEDVLKSYAADFERTGYRPFVYPDVYPAGDEYVLVFEITGRRIPPGGIPLHVDCLVDNVETIVNVANAADGMPVVEKFVSICGAVQQPLTTVVPIGVSIAECIQLAGGATVEDPVVLTGGVMMGGVALDLTIPVTKTMGGIIVLPRDHYLIRRKTASQATYTRIGHGQCDQCSLCTELCPRYTMGYPIQPHLVMRTLLMTGEAKQRGSLWAQYCCECNICSLIACPEQLDPKNICVDAKKLLREYGLTRTETELQTLFAAPHPVRKGREIPIATLYQRLGLSQYDRPADFHLTNMKPRQVSVALNSHIGRPAQATVEVGDSVKRGEVIGAVAGDQLGCPAHASIDGRVTAVTPSHVTIAPVGSSNLNKG